MGAQLNSPETSWGIWVCRLHL